MNMDFGTRLFHGKFIRFMSGSEKRILVNFCECRDDIPPLRIAVGVIARDYLFPILLYSF